MLTKLTGRFARQQRLTQASEFKSVFANPCVKQGDASMLVLGIKNNHNTARLGLAVAKKQLKHAVSRNRFKRLTRESFRHHLDIIKDLDIVVIARAGAAKKTNRELLDLLSKNWHILRKKCEKLSQV
ncbi:MAG: ribonuclease P protein component [Gammaproteobacteria bacterium]|nr:ribonuclease P protein component [Gammaproteobacteria bacterium]MCW8986304.1 ribonuclease P protein component [Gammaproteobacteria bacterium]MCW9031557.1 ribonuclease P protein component [Gammaproteobacteria bacterium]